MFIDESGEANITNLDARFNTFVLCGILFSEDNYHLFNEEMKRIKVKFFNSLDVIFHSFEMRKKSGIFKIFMQEEIIQEFYLDIGNLFSNFDYKIISCVIDKQRYKEIYPEKNYAYEDALTFICERAVRYIGINAGHRLHICLEKRNKGKDSFLKKHYTNLIRYGTQYMSTNACRTCHPKLHFRGKGENINGLQMADLCAYPIARKCLTPESPQPTFEIIKHKFHCNRYGDYQGIGLKRFP